MKLQAPSRAALGTFVLDLGMTALSFIVALWLRLGDQLGQQWDTPRLIQVTGLFVLVAGVVYWWQGMYRGVWRYVSTGDLVVIARAATLSILLYLPALFLINRLELFPRSMLVIEWFVLCALLGGPRLLWRMVTEHRLDLSINRTAGRRVPALLVGEGDAAELFLRACRRGEAEYRPVGLLALQSGSVGRVILGVPVRGTLADLEKVTEDLKARGLAPQRLIIAAPDLAGAELRHLFDRADALGMSLARLPRLTGLALTRDERPKIAPIAVEDLLGRPQTVLDRAAMRAMLQGRRVLVTGAGGSIGSELARQIAASAPARLCLLEASEFALYGIDMEIGERHPDLPRRAALADVRDRERIAALFVEEKPELIFHAAALKHVPLVEANPLEGLFTNAIGTSIVAEAALAAGVGLMVMISTDKAVNPTSVMGASKRAAETWCQALDSAGTGDSTRFVTVRFGNVLGSTGSVVPLFQRQLTAGGPLTVTHPDMTRYFMTVREAVELVLQASALGRATETWRGRIFVLDMGEPVRILDLARQMIRLAGLRPDIDIRIDFTGLRPGEKLFEELFHSEEPPLPTGQEGVLVAAARARSVRDIAQPFRILEAACRHLDPAAALAALGALVPEYAGPAETGPISSNNPGRDAPPNPS